MDYYRLAKMFAFALGVAVIAFVGLRVYGKAGGGGAALPGAPGTSLSQFAELMMVVPAQGSTVCPSPKITVAIRLNDALRKSGSFDLSKVALLLDGTDVTRKALVIGTQEYPQGSASLTYAPETALVAGTHRAAFTFASDKGTKTYAWAFTVASISCQPGSGTSYEAPVKSP